MACAGLYVGDVRERLKLCFCKVQIATLEVLMKVKGPTIFFFNKQCSSTLLGLVW